MFIVFWLQERHMNSTTQTKSVLVFNQIKWLVTEHLRPTQGKKNKTKKHIMENLLVTILTNRDF